MSCKCKPIYAKRDTKAQGSHYIKHLCHMTAEGLHDKSEIAAELAHRDIEIGRLEKSLRIAAGYIFTTNGHTHKHPQEILEWLKEQS